jgi:hypothetical protein
MHVLVRFGLVVFLAAAGGCVSEGNGNGGGDHPDLSTTGGDDLAIPDDADLTDLPPATLQVVPDTLQTITVQAGANTPTVTYSATYGGSPINVAWSVDRIEAGTVAGGPSSSTAFTPTGAAGGLVTLTAGLNGQTLTRQIQINLTASQNGPSAGEAGQVATTTGQLTAGGGVGGVGGEGLGSAVTDTPTLTALGNPGSNGSAQNLMMLYPYDGTVWPRGLLAPLLMWRWTPGDADAIQIKLSTSSGSFSWTGTFAKPAILGAAGAFVRHPIPQDVWDMATNTAGGADKLTVSLTVAKSGQAYGPLTQTWTIAKGRLAGIIYYNSYGTQLAKNFTGAKGGDGNFGGAVLSIHAGDTAPKLAAGANGNSAQCRVCHSVAAYGSRLVAQHGDTNSIASSYELTPGGTSENMPSSTTNSFPGIYPDGSLMLTTDGKLWNLPVNGGSATTPTGLSVVTTSLGPPIFAPDGLLVAFNPMATPIASATQKLVVMDYNNGTQTFSNARTVVDDSASGNAQIRPGWPAFLPDGKSLVFHHQSASGSDGNGDGALWTRKGARAHLSWAQVGATPSVVDCDQANGKGYLPQLLTASTVTTCSADGVAVGGIDTSHQDDVDLNYEPTVSPLPAGGYAWVVFTSRRMYGNEATIPPFCSDPRGVDLISNITTKKLWVAAIDLATGAVDPSHPAFYLPGQELLAGNSRGFWVLDPCRMDGQSCMTGDQCCHGYCEPGGDGGLQCTSTPPNNQCSKVQEHCDTAANCCDPTNQCINGFCTSQIL